MANDKFQITTAKWEMRNGKWQMRNSISQVTPSPIGEKLNQKSQISNQK